MALHGKTTDARFYPRTSIPSTDPGPGEKDGGSVPSTILVTIEPHQKHPLI